MTPTRPPARDLCDESEHSEAFSGEVDVIADLIRDRFAVGNAAKSTTWSMFREREFANML
jgi:hypothetical protein